jgi:hypothetical protein
MVRSSIRWWAAAGVTALALVAGVLAGVALTEPAGSAGDRSGRAQPTDVVLDLGALGKPAALRTCATRSFVAGKPGSLRVRYGMKQRTPQSAKGSFVLRNHAGQFMFCDMFGRDYPAVLPMPGTNPRRPAVYVTNSRRDWRCSADSLTRFRTNAWFKVQDPVRSARMRYWVDGVAGPWFVSQRQGRYLHRQSWLFTPPEGAGLQIQTQVRNEAGQVMQVRGIPSGPRRLLVTCGAEIG